MYRLPFEAAAFDVVHAHQVCSTLGPGCRADRNAAGLPPGGLLRPATAITAACSGSRKTRNWLSGRPCTGTWPGPWAASPTRAGIGWPGPARPGSASIEPSGSAWSIPGRTTGPGGADPVGGDRIALRGPGGRTRPGEPGRSGAADPGLAALGGQRGRLVLHPARRDHLHRLGGGRAAHSSLKYLSPHFRGVDGLGG